MATTSTVVVLACLSLISFASAQVRWCANSGPELRKCREMRDAFADNGLDPVICIEVLHDTQCLRMIAANEADVKSVDDRGIYTSGGYLSMRPIISEIMGGTQVNYNYMSVMVVRRSNQDIRSIADLRNKISCHTAVMRTVGWMIPVGALYTRGGMTSVDCENNVKNIANHFTQSCSPGAYDAYNNPDQDNPLNACSVCNDAACPLPGERYSGYTGAFRGLVDGRCDVAFVRETTVPYDAREEFPYNPDDYELLCPNDRRVDVNSWPTCNWAVRRTNAIVSRANYNVPYLRNLLGIAVQFFGPNGIRSDQFQLFNSTKYGRPNLMFSDSSINFDTISEGDYKAYLGDGFTASYQTFRPAACRKEMRWCTISDAEHRKCLQMKMGMSAGRITQYTSCVQGQSVEDCVAKVQNSEADLLTVNHGYVYSTGRYNNTRPISAELYNDFPSSTTTYYGVAVIRAGTNVDLRNMRGRHTCHTSFGGTVGWTLPVGFFADRGDFHINETQCLSGPAAAGFLGDMCTPGALEGGLGEIHPTKMCSLCPANCQGNGQYSGYNGALRCLMETDADVAFVKQNTVDDVLNGDFDWARGWRKEDFQLACTNGTWVGVDDWQGCSLARVASNAVITSNQRDSAHVRNFQIALDRAQSRYRSDDNTFFAMFNSEPGHSNLLFKDGAIGLTRVNTNYQDFLGQEYFRALSALDPDQHCAPSKDPPKKTQKRVNKEKRTKK